MRRKIHGAVAAALISTVPVTAANAAVRPGSAVPVSSSAAVAAQTTYDNRGSGLAAGWPVLAFGAIMVALVLLEVLDDEDDDRPESRG